MIHKKVKSNHFIGREVPLYYLLTSFASQENCDGEMYDSMQLAGEYIKELEIEKDKLLSKIKELEKRNHNMLNISNILTLKDLVNTINNGGIASAEKEYSPEEVAAQYAYDACKEAGCGYDKCDLLSHLEFLANNNAVFDFNKALDIAINI